MRTWADWDDAQPGLVEIDLVSYDGGNTAGQVAFTLAVRHRLQDAVPDPGVGL